MDALADAIAGLLEDREGGQALGQRLRKRVMDHFSWQNTARQVSQAYDIAIALEARVGGQRPAANALAGEPMAVDGQRMTNDESEETGENKKKRNRILNIVRIAVSLLGLAIIVLTQDLGQAFRLLLDMDWLPFLATLVLFLSGSFVRAYRWGCLVWALGVQVSYWRLVDLYFIGAFFNQFLPTGVGGDAVKMFELSREDGKAASAISSVLVDRFLGLFVLFALALLALLVGHELVPQQVRILIAIVFAASLIWRSPDLAAHLDRGLGEAAGRGPGAGPDQDLARAVRIALPLRHSGFAQGHRGLAGLEPAPGPWLLFVGAGGGHRPVAVVLFPVRAHHLGTAVDPFCRRAWASAKGLPSFCSRRWGCPNHRPWPWPWPTSLPCGSSP